MRNNWELRKRGYLIRFGHTEALLWKKRTLNGHFSRPAQTDPNEHQYALCMIWDWLVCTAFKLLYKDLELNYPKTWFCIIWWLSNKMNITISLCLLEDFFFSQPLPLDLCGPHLSFSLLDTNRGAFFAWRAPILSWPRITCSQVCMLKFLEPSREMP